VRADSGLTALPDGTLCGGATGLVYRLDRVSNLAAKAAYTVFPFKKSITLNPQATLTDLMTGVPVVGRKVTFTSDLSEVCAAYTDANGVAKCQATVADHANELDGLSIDASFEDDLVYTSDTDHASLLCIGKTCLPDPGVGL